MAVDVQEGGVLENPICLTFDTEEDGDSYARKLKAMFDKGLVPTEFKGEVRVGTVEQLVREYEDRVGL